jgi:hypothetical protein
MPEPKSPDGLERFSRLLGQWFLRPVGKLALTVLLCLSLAGCTHWDEHVRTNGVKSLPMAPSREDFLLSLQFGALIGLVAFLADFSHSLGRAFTRLFRVSRGQGRPRPRWPRVNLGALWTNGWTVLCLAMLCALVGWCALHQVFPPPAWLAALAVVIPGSLLLDLIFGVETPEVSAATAAAEE